MIGPTGEIASSYGIGGLVDEPWYVIVSVLAFAAAALWVEGQMKKHRWPYKGDNDYVHHAILVGALLIVGVPIALLVNWLAG